MFLGAKVRRFPHSHNPLCMAFRIPQRWYIADLVSFATLFLMRAPELIQLLKAVIINDLL